MTKQVAFSNEAYAALKREKQAHESFSDLVVRLMREARIQKKDPMRFANFAHKRAWPVKDHLSLVEALRDHDRADAWWLDPKDKPADAKRTQQGQSEP